MGAPCRAGLILSEISLILCPKKGNWLADGFLALPYAKEVAEAGLVEADLARAGALVSIIGVREKPARIDERRFAYGVLRVSFDDIPVPEWVAADGSRWFGPYEEQVRDVLTFGRHVRAAGCDHVAVHCLHGRSRSPAVAVAMMADALGPGREAEAVSRLMTRSARPGVAPDPDSVRRILCNPGVIRLADGIMGRGGALERAVAAGVPLYAAWEGFWQAQCLVP
ncbi:hypothetical protein [Nguyenibacter vanlangensis]|uniref:Tyrosine specific protein phosphatases domain-containing protein n=1 Tax=Nguyenibacter vanlangensis TaxID=1216886 RepID=A0A7Y7IV47_9PROT|nr:hypothetical protein [Nguyenibacter vanlangensis]NVN10910.1 hypothetical protein [Nguyenibacter vanlangensis]